MKNKRKVKFKKNTAMGFVIFDDTENSIQSAITETTVYISFFVTEKDAKNFIKIMHRMIKPKHKYKIHKSELKII